MPPPPRSPSGLFEHREDVSRGILEPRDVRTAAAAGDAPVVLRHAFVPLELHACAGQLVDGLLDVLDGEVEDRERRRLVVVLRIHEHRCPSAEPQLEPGRVLLDRQPERSAVELLRPVEVVDREAGKRLRALEHQ
jgi:hypothetical protein